MARQARAVLTRRKILVAAAEVFDEQGYTSASMAEIFARAGVTKGALYFHFESKEELAKAVIAADQQYYELPEGISSPLQAAIDISHFFAHALRSDVIARASVRLAIEHGTFSGGAFTTHILWQEKARNLFVLAAEQGELKPGVDLDAAAELLVSAFTGIQVVSQAISGRRDLHRRLTHFWKIFLPSLVPEDRLSDYYPEGSPEGRKYAEQASRGDVEIERER